MHKFKNPVNKLVDVTVCGCSSNIHISCGKVLKHLVIVMLKQISMNILCLTFLYPRQLLGASCHMLCSFVMSSIILSRTLELRQYGKSF